MTMMIIQGVLPRHLDGAEHRQQRLAKSGRTHAGNQYHHVIIIIITNITIIIILP